MRLISSSAPTALRNRVRLVCAALLAAASMFFTLAAAGVDFGLDAFGGADVNLITGAETSPRVTQSESSVWGHGNTVVVAYNDSSGSNLTPLSICGVSVSTNGGASFTRLPYKFNETGECYGVPDVVYSVRARLWFVSFIAARCGGAGIGLWVSADGITWTENGCTASGTSQDRGSLWVDNNPGSSFYGRMYSAFNDSGGVGTTYSTFDGSLWTAPLSLSSTFLRALKVTGSPGPDGTIFVQTLDEGGGGLFGSRRNKIFRSTDGGVTWSPAINQGATFRGPGRYSSGYYAGMYQTPTLGYWRDMGWGQPAVGPGGVVHYVYSERPVSPNDPGNIHYVRSTDNGLTWASPVQLNTDATLRAQWSPSISVNSQGKVFVSWYDERNTTNDFLERFGRSSADNGATWQNDMPLSDVIYPKPLQPDPIIVGNYAGDYNYASFSDSGTGDVAYHAWTDGRVAITGAPQQDVFVDRISFAPLAPQAVVSRKLHSGLGPFDVDLPLNGTSGVEPRTGGATGDYELGITFASPVTVNGTPQADVTTGAGEVGTGGIPNGGVVSVAGAVVIVPLTNVTNAQSIVLTLFNVNDGLNVGNVTVRMSVLAGDSNNDRAVNSGDALQTRNRSGQASDATNFRSDINTDGFVNSGDAFIVRARSGTALP